MKLQHIALAALVVIVSLAGQALVKGGLNEVKAAAAQRPDISVLSTVWTAVTNLRFAAGFFVMVASAVLYLVLLYFADFTRALPIMGAIAYLLIPLIGLFWLGERVTLSQMAGIMLLLAGIALLRK